MISVNTRRVLKQVQIKILNLTLSIIIALVGLVTAAPMFFSATASAVSLATIYVQPLGNDICDGSTPEAAPGTTPGACAKVTIQAAITAVDTGGTINVADGTYTENLTINKALTLDGQSRTGTIIDAGAVGGGICCRGDGKRC